jgi:DNA-binding NtrC family response regulator
MQVGAAWAPAVLLRGCDRLARTLRRSRANPIPGCMMTMRLPSAVSSPVASEKLPRASGPDEAQKLASLLPIGADFKARIRILVVDDEHTLRESCASVLRHDGYDVTLCGRGQEALELLKRRGFDIVLVDLYMAQVDGLMLLRTALGTNRDTIVIVMTGNPSVESSVEALRQGAWDYLPKPFSATHLQILMGRALHTLLVARETEEQQTELERHHGHSDKITLLGTATAFRQAMELARKVAPTDASVFITGESGSGKEMIAQFIHHHSRRSSRPFVAVNCAALPEGLLESEMFGHRKGAFTGAVRDKPGLLESANGGTLFLDELIEMSKPIQAKLLRAIQDGIVRRVGSETTDAVVNVRFIAATNGDAEAALKSGDLREDLYYRLRVVPIHVPSLRERAEDIPLLADYFLSTYWVRHRNKGAPFPRLTDGAIQALSAHSWRGNVRELQNVIEHVAVIAEPGAEIRPEDLHLVADPEPVVGANPASLISTLLNESYHAARDRVVAQFERQYLTWLVNRVGGNMSKAARIAGVDRTTLYRLMGRHGLQRSPSTGWVIEREGVPAESVPDEDPHAQVV